MMYKIKALLRKLKQGFQRAFRGYDDRAVYDFYNWFCLTIPKIMNDYSKGFYGVPMEIDDDVKKSIAMGVISPEEEDSIAVERWRNILQLIAMYFREASEDTCSRKNALDPDEDLEAWSKEEQEIFNYQKECKDKGLDLIKYWFFDLWD